MKNAPFLEINLEQKLKISSIVANHKTKFKIVFQRNKVDFANPNNNGKPLIAAIKEGRISFGLNEKYKSSEALI
jgi:hypothetical protein